MDESASERRFQEAEIRHVMREVRHLIATRPVSTTTLKASLLPTLVIVAISAVLAARAFVEEDNVFGLVYVLVGALTAAISFGWAMNRRRQVDEWVRNRNLAMQDLQALMKALDPVEDDAWFEVAELVGELMRPRDSYFSLKDFHDQAFVRKGGFGGRES